MSKIFDPFEEDQTGASPFAEDEESRLLSNAKPGMAVQDVARPENKPLVHAILVNGGSSVTYH